MFLLGVSACERPGTSPTVDPNLIFTSAAQTVEAQLTEAAAQPSEDPNLIRTEAAQTVMAQMQTNTPLASPQPLGGATLPAAIPGTPVIGTLPVLKTNTPAAPATSKADKVEFVGQYPADGSSLPTNHGFDTIWEIRNIGTNRWTTGYYVEFWDTSTSNRIGPSSYPRIYYFRNNVLPNEIYKVVVDMQTGNTTGTFKSVWVLKNDQAQPFYELNVTINVFQDIGDKERTATAWAQTATKETLNKIQLCCVQDPNTYAPGSTEQNTCREFLAARPLQVKAETITFCSVVTCGAEGGFSGTYVCPAS